LTRVYQNPVWLITVLEKGSQKKQITSLWSAVAVKVDSKFIKLAWCLCEKIKLPVMDIGQ